MIFLFHCRSVYYAASDVVILRFMVEVCWAPMLAAFSVPLDQSDDAVITSLCLEGFHHAIHVTSVMSLKTHRDAFVTSLAKFTSLHSPADIKQKNIEAIKVCIFSLSIFFLIFRVKEELGKSHSVLSFILYWISIHIVFENLGKNMRCFFLSFSSL